MSESKNKNGSDIFTALAIVLATLVRFFGGVVIKGIRKKKIWTRDATFFWIGYFIWLCLIVYSPSWNVPTIVDFLWPKSGFGNCLFQYVARWMQLLILYGVPILSWLFCLGIFDWLAIVKFQKCINHLGLKTPTDLTPRVTRVISLENGQKKILVHAVGIDVATFREKKGALESSLNAIVQDVGVSALNRQVFEILISEKELPKLIRFESVENKLSKPYSFLVGQAMDTFIVADLCELHHMLIAGATGGGKSVFFKQALIGLLKSSKHIQLYLLDLKRGVDVKPFEVLDNVEIAKDTMTAISALRAVANEMERRFRYLEEKGFTEIEPVRDRFDRIIVAIDEASVLFTVEKSSRTAKGNALTARELTDQLAKLGRAAGIHVILATQKVVKETIDTRVQTNINARMCFRVNTVASSMTVLGNKKAAELPEIKGRGIWSVGSKDIIVQVPKLDNEEIIEEANALTSKFNGESSPLFQSMLEVSSPVAKRGQAFVEDDSESTETARKES